MPDIFGTVQGSKEIQDLLKGAREQLPFTLSLAANKTINAAQTAIRDSLPLKFHLRRWDFVTRTIYRKPGIWPTGDNASKAEPTAAVRVHPDRDFLAKFEEGGEKRSRSGGNLLVPTIRIQEPNLIIRRSDPLHPSKLPGSLTRSSKVRLTSKAGAFVVQRPGGARFVLQRIAKGIVRVIYTFRRSVKIPKKLGFYETGIKAIDATWEKNLREALDRALKTAR